MSVRKFTLTSPIIDKRSELDCDIGNLKCQITNFEKERIADRLKSLKNDEIRLSKCIDEVEVFHRDMFKLFSSEEVTAAAENKFSMDDKRKKRKLSATEHDFSLNDLQCSIVEIDNSVNVPEFFVVQQQYESNEPGYPLNEHYYLVDHPPDNVVNPQNYSVNQMNVSMNQADHSVNQQEYSVNQMNVTMNQADHSVNQQEYSVNPIDFTINQSDCAINNPGYSRNQADCSENNPDDSRIQPISELPADIFQDTSSLESVPQDSDETDVSKSKSSNSNGNSNGSSDRSCDCSDTSNDSSDKIYTSDEKPNTSSDKSNDCSDSSNDSSDKLNTSGDKPNSNSDKSNCIPGASLYIDKESTVDREELAKEVLQMLLTNGESEVTKLVLHLIFKFSSFQKSLQAAETAKLQQTNTANKSCHYFERTLEPLDETVLYLDKLMFKIYSKYLEILNNILKN